MTELAAGPARPDGDGIAPRRRRGGRRWWLAVIALAVTIAVVTDLSVHATAGYRRAQLRGYLSAVAGDVAACQAGLRDAVTAYAAWAGGTPGASRGTAVTFARQAIAVCGFADDSIVRLSSEQPPRSIASPAVDRVALAIARWAYLDAFTFLQDLAVLAEHPASAPAGKSAAAALNALRAQRGRAQRLAAIAARAGHLSAPVVRLIRVTSLLPDGSLPVRRGKGR